MSPMLLLTHPTGNANVRAAARAFQSANLLQELHSCICWDPESTLARRSFVDVPLSVQHSHPWRELLRLLGPYLLRLKLHKSGPLSIDAVYRSFDRHVAARIPQLQGLQLADQVIVASAYVRSTLLDQQACSAPIAVVPYGAPAPLLEPPATSSTGPLRVLYVGSLGQRKGLSYALEAIGSLGTQVSLTLIGNPTSSSCKPLLSALGRHRHITSLPHHQILERMRQHDVLLFPTLFDGCGLVITEALSQGLPAARRRAQLVWL